jgi:hypothetical protein
MTVTGRRPCSIRVAIWTGWSTRPPILTAAESYLLITRLTSWDLDTYQGLLATSFTP